MNCTPYKTITFNDDGYDNGMTWKQGKTYNYFFDKERNNVQVFLGSGYLFFEQEEFNKHFKII